MKFALVNPPWTFAGSIYFGCREPHLPLEYGYARATLEGEGHEVAILDGQLNRLTYDDIRRDLAAFRPDRTVITTAPSYLFWRCAPPELRVPQELLAVIRDVAGVIIAIGPHASTTPRATLGKLGCDAAVLGEAEEILPRLAAPQSAWPSVPSVVFECAGVVQTNAGLHASNMEALPALRWDDTMVGRHVHHHHRFDDAPQAPGAEMETSRGCPYHCTFCAKENFRNLYRRRPLPVLLEELDALLKQGVEYVYFIDEIFLPNEALLKAFIPRQFKFGVQTRIDLWQPAMIDLLGAAGCVSIEAGVESISETGRNLLDKRSRLTTEEIAARLIHARNSIPFVQANLLDAQVDADDEVAAWRERLIAHRVWANNPVPLFPYPGSPEYTRRWGNPDDSAWERAVDDYLVRFDSFSDIQEHRPLRLNDIECSPRRTVS